MQLDGMNKEKIGQKRLSISAEEVNKQTEKMRHFYFNAEMFPRSNVCKKYRAEPFENHHRSFSLSGTTLGTGFSHRERLITLGKIIRAPFG